MYKQYNELKYIRNIEEKFMNIGDTFDDGTFKYTIINENSVSIIQQQLNQILKN